MVKKRHFCAVLNDQNICVLEYCQQTGLTFSEKMLTWKPGPLPEWDISDTVWYKDVLESSGFTPEKSENVNMKLAITQYPAEVQQCVTECMPYYEYLYSKKTFF